MTTEEALAIVPNATLGDPIRREACLWLASVSPSEPNFSRALEVVSQAASSSSSISDVAVTALDMLHRSICNFQRDHAIENARDKLRDIAIRSMDTLWGVLRDITRSIEQRTAALYLIGEEGSIDDIEPLLEEIQRSDEDLTLLTGSSLATLVTRHRPKGNVVSELIRLVQRNSEPLTREAALYALRMIGNTEAIECARAVYEDAETPLHVRLEALRTAAQLGDQDSAFRGLSDPSPDVRVAAIGLINSSASGVKDVLLQLLSDDAKTVTTLDGESVADAVRWTLDHKPPPIVD